MSQLFASVGQSIGVSASESVLPMNIQGGFPLGLTGWISLQSKGLSRIVSSTTVRKHRFLNAWPSHGPILTSILDYWKNHSFDNTNLCCKVMSLLFNMLSRFVMAFLPGSKRLLIPWLRLPSAMILEPKKIKYVTVSLFPHLFAMK